MYHKDPFSHMFILQVNRCDLNVDKCQEVSCKFKCKIPVCNFRVGVCVWVIS